MPQAHPSERHVWRCGVGSGAGPHPSSAATTATIILFFDIIEHL
jgi:hypothetical protein